MLGSPGGQGARRDADRSRRASATPRIGSASRPRQRGRLNRSHHRQRLGRISARHGTQDHSGVCICVAQGASGRQRPGIPTARLSARGQAPTTSTRIDSSSSRAEGAAEVTSDPHHARELLEEALSLWRGRPYLDLADADALRPCDSSPGADPRHGTRNADRCRSLRRSGNRCAWPSSKI